MKKRIFGLFFVFLLLFIVGCESNNQENFTEIKDYLMKKYNNMMISEDVSFPLNIEEYSCNLEWNYNSEYLLNNGKFIAPEEDTNLLVKVKIVLNEKCEEVSFNIILKGWINDFTEVSSYLDSIYSEKFKSLLDRDVELINSFKNAKITWETSDKKVITNNGKIIRSDVDGSAVLRCKINIDNHEVVKEYKVSVKKSDHSFDEVKEWLINNYNNKVIAKDIELPKELDNFSARLEWMIGEDSYLTEDGKFSAPVVDMITDVFVTVYMNGTSKEVDLIFNLVGWGTEMDAIKEWIKTQIDSSLTHSIVFPEVYPLYNAKIRWESSNEKVLSNTGIINKDNDNDIEVKLTCYIEYEDEKSSLEIITKVLKKGDNEKNFEVRAWLDEKFSNLGVVSGDLTLPTTDLVYGANITWQSNSPGIISESGKYNVPLFDRTVQLTATSVLGSHTLKITYSFDTLRKESSGVWEDVERVLSYIALEHITNQKYYTFGYQEAYQKNLVQNVGYLPFYVNEKANQIVEILELTHGKNRTGIKKTSTEYIVIHDTGSAAPDATARAHANWLKNMTLDENNETYISWHFTVDEKEIIQHLPLDETAFHAGDGQTTYPNTWSGGLGGGNKNGIGIETCVNYGSDYNITMRKTAKLVAELLIEFDLGLDRVKQHNDFSGKDCPQTMRHAERWQEFMTLVEIEYFGKTILKDVNFKWTSLSPSIMDDTGKIINHPGSEGTVKYQVEVTYNNETRIFKFESTLDELEK